MQIDSLSPDARGRLTSLAASLREAYGPDLVSVTLYGSAARGDQVAGSDLNVVVVLRDLSLESLERGAGAVRSWQTAGNRSLLFFSPEWIERSADVFPLEFSDMRQWHVVIEGSDPFASFDAARETLEVYAPLAHSLGIHTVKWELEDLAFETLHPRKYTEIQAMVNQRRADREKFVQNAGKLLNRELGKVDIPAEISSRAKHFYSIYEKMAKRG